MLRAEIFTLIAQLAPNTSVVRRTQAANVIFRLSTEQSFDTRRRHRYLVSSGIQYPLFRSYVSGMRDGQYAMFLGSYCLVRIYYVCGNKHGFTIEWDRSGNLYHQTAYRHGKLHGASVGWYESGKIRRHVTYVNDKIQGERMKWYSNGQLRERVQYDNGAPGYVERWSNDGEILE